MLAEKLRKQTSQKNNSVNKLNYKTRFSRVPENVSCHRMFCRVLDVYAVRLL
jgi:hypothetical protein